MLLLVCERCGFTGGIGSLTAAENTGWVVKEDGADETKGAVCPTCARMLALQTERIEQARALIRQARALLAQSVEQHAIADELIAQLAAVIREARTEQARSRHVRRRRTSRP